MLTVAIGNTTTRFGVWPDGIVYHTVTLPSDRSLSVEEWTRAIGEILSIAGGISGQPFVYCSSVVPQLTPALMKSLRNLFPTTNVILIDSSAPLGFGVHYHPPHTLGSDRYLCAYAVRRLFLTDDSPYTQAVIVDCGTATTFGVVSRERGFLGGAILPGIGTSMTALLQRAAQLPDFSLASAPLIATNTEDGLRSGMVHGFSAQIGGLLARYRAAVGAAERTLVVATGGAFPVVAQAVAVDHFEPDLLLRGLYLAGTQLTEGFDRP